MKRFFLSLVMATAMAVSIPAHAATDTTTPDNNKWKLTTISWIKANENDLDKDDKYVVLIGKVTQKHNGDTYFFQDETGKIELDSDIELPVGQTIVVRGRIDQAFLHIGPLELNVDSWRHIKNQGEILK